jgi:hypothetical protein
MADGEAETSKQKDKIRDAALLTRLGLCEAEGSGFKMEHALHHFRSFY